MMPNSAYHFFTGLLLAVAVLVVLILLPFLTPVVLALALAVIFGPIYRFVLRTFFKNKEKSSFASFLVVLVVGIVVLVPGALIIGKLYTEIQDMYYFLTEETGRSGVIALLNSVTQWLSHALFDLFPAYTFDTLNITEYLRAGLEWAFSNIDTLFTGLSKVLLGIFLGFLALFYFLRDGKELKRQIIALSPLVDTDDERILKRLEQAVYSIFAGSLIVGVIQGILTGIGFALFGVPNPAVWGTIAAIAALIPGIGTSLVLVPGILYLFFMDMTGPAVGLLIWGIVAVGLIDNILGPILINRGIKIHPFLILLSVLGGLMFFGAIGFILGPLILALLFALLEIYRTSRI